MSPTSRSKRPQSKPGYEAALAFQCRATGLPEPFLEYQGIPGRKFRFDLAWPDRMIYCEIQGGVWNQGRHSRGAGITTDCEKASLAAIHGWRGLFVTGQMVTSGKALRFLTQALNAGVTPVDERKDSPA